MLAMMKMTEINYEMTEITFNLGHLIVVLMSEIRRKQATTNK